MIFGCLKPQINVGIRIQAVYQIWDAKQRPKKWSNKLLTKSLGIPAYLVDNPMTCVVEGAMKSFSMLNVLRRNLPQV